MRIAVRVKPGSSRAAVGGMYGDGELVVAVTQRPVDGAATDAVVRAVAKAFGIGRGEVRLVTGASARTKVLHLDGDAAELASRLAELLAA